MSSGTYFPKPVKAVATPKKNGGTRILGIPTVEDRGAQMVAKIYFEPMVRYADNGALNCVSIKQAKYIIKGFDKRFKTFGLELNLTKTKIVIALKRLDSNKRYMIAVTDNDGISNSIFILKIKI